MFYSSIGAEILRKCRVNSTSDNFVSSAKTLLERAHKQGAKYIKLSKTLKKVYERHQVLHKVSKNASEFCACLFNKSAA